VAGGAIGGALTPEAGAGDGPVAGTGAGVGVGGGATTTGLGSGGAFGSMNLFGTPLAAGPPQ
jgi:hypothetical protein